MLPLVLYESLKSIHLIDNEKLLQVSCFCSFTKVSSFLKVFCISLITLLPAASSGTVRDKPPAAGSELQPQLPHLLLGGGRLPEETGGQGVGHRARAGAGHQGQQWALSLSRTLVYVYCTAYIINTASYPCCLPHFSNSNAL